MSTGIQWTDETWNPVTGCSKVSQGCKFCYAERLFPRVYSGRAFTDVRCHPDRLDKPLRWKKPRMVFVNSMSDLFHEAVPFNFIAKVWDVCALASQHTFQILTKRPERMIEFAQWMAGRDHISIAEWPRNVWLGVSVEDHATSDARIPLLLQTPAAVRFISYEPALGPVDLTALPSASGIGRFLDALSNAGVDPGADIPGRLGWVICGGESGPKARPSHPRWFRDVRDQCNAAGVPFFFKQWGEWAPHAKPPQRGVNTGAGLFILGNGQCGNQGDWWNGTAHAADKLGKHKAGRLLDGREWNEYPNSLKGDPPCQTSTPQNSASKCSS